MINKIGSDSLSTISEAKKTITKGGEALIFQVVQNTMYAYPHASVVRELASNCRDAISEKNIARRIIVDGEPVDKYFITREGDAYEDSKFNSSYYNFNFLNQQDLIKIELVHGEPGQKDSLCFTDTGVGLSESRLVKMNQLAFSTKRNTQTALGNYGLGAKSPIAVSPVYYIESAYNGWLRKLEVTETGFRNVIHPLGNEPYDLGDGILGYAQEYSGLNYTKIIVPVRSSNRAAYVEAIKSQLCYFENLEFWNNGYQEIVAANVLYETDNIIISDKMRFTHPHFVVVQDPAQRLGGVNYGVVDFGELELQSRNAPIGIKVTLLSRIEDGEGGYVTVRDGVTCSPSREMITYSDHTREYLMNKLNLVEQECSEYISDKLLKDSDLFEWTKIADSLGNGNGDPVLNIFRKMIGEGNIRVTWPRDKKIVFSYSIDSFMSGYRCRVVQLGRREGTDKYRQVSRDGLADWSRFHNYRRFMTTETASIAKDNYLAESEPFVLISRRSPSEEADFYSKMNKKEVELYELKKKYVEEMLEQVCQDYDAVEVPVTWESEKEKVHKEQTKGRDQLRKERGQVVVKQFRRRGYNDNNPSPLLRIPETLDKQDLIDSEGYYATLDDVSAAEFVFMIGRTDTVLVSKDVVRLCKNRKHIKEFFINLENNTITMDNRLLNYYTTKLVSEAAGQLIFLSHFEELPEHAQYLRLRQYLNGQPSYPKGQLPNDVKTEVDKIGSILLDIQLLQHEGASEEEVTAEIKNKLGIVANKVNAINMEVYSIALALLEWSKPFRDILNALGYQITNEPKIKEKALEYMNMF